MLYALIDNVVDRYFPVLDQLETRLEASEEQLSSSASSRGKIEELYAIKRQLMALKHVVAPLMEAVGKLYGGRVPHLCRDAGILPRRLRSSRPDQRHDRKHPRNADDRDPGESRADRHRRQRGDEAARRVGGA